MKTTVLYITPHSLDMEGQVVATTYHDAGARQTVFGLELLSILEAVVDQAKSGALASTVVSSETEQDDCRGVRDSEFLFERTAG